MTFSRIVRWACALLALGLVLLGCSSSDAQDTAGTDLTAQETSTPEISTPETSTPETSAPEESDTGPTAADGSEEEMFPNVLDATATSEGPSSSEGTVQWTISATLSSPYDSPDRYADAWRVVGPNGTVYGERILTHDHAGEQPFTRSQNGIAIPTDVTTVTIEGRDQVSGWGGETFTLDLSA